MAQTGYTPIQLYNSATPSAAPTAGNLATGELALNIADGKLFYKDSGGVVQVLATKGAGTIGGSDTQVQYNSSGALAGSANLTFNGTLLTAAEATVTGATTLSATTQNLALGTSQTSGTWTAGGAAQTGAMTLDQSTKTHTLSLGTGATESGATKTINFGTGGVSGSTTAIAIGSANGTTTTLNGTVTAATFNSTTIDTTNIEVTNVKAKDGTSAATIADSTGVVSFTANPVMSGGTANGVTYLNGSKVLTSGSALTFDGTTFAAPLTSLSGNGVVLTVDRTGTGGNDRTNVQFSNSGTVRGGIGTVGASDGIYFNQGTLEGMRLTSTGLGIGTSSPAYKLHVSNYMGLGTQASSGAGAGINMIPSSTLTNWFVGSNYVNPGAFEIIPSTAGGGSTFSTPALVLNSSGNLGIGTSSPGAKLDVNGGATIQGLTVGRGAGAVSTNTAVGYQAQNATATLGSTTAIGYQAAYSNTGAEGLTYVGRWAGYSTTTGSNNTTVGVNSFFNNTTGANNTAHGHSALFSNTTASNNTAVGYQAGYSNQTGAANTFIGYQAGYYTTGGPNGRNVFVGEAAGYNNTTGRFNTYLGHYAGQAMTTGASNTIIGRYDGNMGGLDIRTANNNIVLSDGDGNPQVVIPKNSSGHGYLLVGPTKADPSGGNYYSTISSVGSDVQLILQRVGDAGAGYGGIGASSTAAFLVYGQGLASVPFRVNQTDGTVILKGGADAATGTGITFPATQSASSNANTLDDYEQGTFTPTLGGTWTTSPTGLSGTYVKIGRQVYVRVYFDGAAAKNTSISGWIDSLPFTVVVEGTGSGVDSNVTNKGNVLFANTSRMWLTDTSFAAGANYFSGTYLAAD